MDWQDAQDVLQKHFGWSDEKAGDAVICFNEACPGLGPQDCVNKWILPPDNVTWVHDFETVWLLQFIAAAKKQAEDDYNILANSQPMIKGQQYVQDNRDGSFTTVVTFKDLKVAEDGFNKVTDGGQLFVVGKRYVQNDLDGTYKVVVRYPMTY